MRARAFRISSTTVAWLGAIAGIFDSGQSHGETAPKPGNLADLCPLVDGRDTIDTVRSRVAARLGAPVKEETVDTQYVLTFRQTDGGQFFVMLTRESNRLEVNCYEQKP